jgi:hypothetical protein
MFRKFRIFVQSFLYTEIEKMKKVQGYPMREDQELEKIFEKSV